MPCLFIPWFLIHATLKVLLSLKKETGLKYEQRLASENKKTCLNSCNVEACPCDSPPSPKDSMNSKNGVGLHWTHWHPVWISSANVCIADSICSGIWARFSARLKMTLFWKSQNHLPSQTEQAQTYVVYSIDGSSSVLLWLAWTALKIQWG